MDWYYTATEDSAVRQVVLVLPPECVVETDFQTIMLPAGNFPILAMNSWCAGFCRINSTHLAMLRTGHFGPDVREAGLTVALSFCHLPSHPLFLMSIRVEAPELVAAVRSEHPYVPPLDRPVAEWVCGLNPFDRRLAEAVFATEPFRVLVAQDSCNRSYVYMPDGSRREAAMPEGVCEFQVCLPAEAMQRLQHEWRELISYDALLPSSRRDFQAATGQEILRYLPLDKDPVLPRR